MSQLYRTILFYCSVLLCLCLSLGSYAEGSKDLYPGGALGNRAYLMSTTTSSRSWPFPTLGTHYAYVKSGETIAAASSAQGNGSGQIWLTAPNGTVYTTTVGVTTIGRILNRTQELAGPFTGYTPYTRVASAAEEGIWKIEFLPVISTSSLVFSAPNIAADGSWAQNGSDNTISAWDVSVSSAGTAATIIPGRVYATVMDMYVTSSGNYYGKLYVQTNDGYTYKVNNNGQAGAGFVFFVNNKGITNGNGDAAQSSYKSLNTSDAANVPIWDPRTADGAQSITHKMFYATPDPGLPSSASLPGGTITWLKVPKMIPTVSSITIDGVEGTTGQVSSKGAYIKFNASQAGAFRIILSGSGGFATRTIRGSAVAGNNSVYWDGKDNNGNAPATGTANITADIQLQGAEVHFPFFDVESNIDGIIIEQLNDDGTVKSDIVYWDDSDASLNGAGAPSPRNNGNDGAGLHSNSNGHKWGTNYGNERTMDTWAYVLGEIASQNTVLNIRKADLAVMPFNPAPLVTQVAAGQPITYKLSVVNNGSSDVEGAPFKFKVPAGFTIANLSDITVTTSCGTVNNALIDASGNYTALLDLPNGCIITFDITGRPGASLAGSSLSMEASIMRPNDVTDPDATNPDPAVPPTDPHVECENGTGTESCNNIKYNSSVTVTASADIVTVKNTAATNYVPGKSVDYTITVTNNGPSDATDVNVVDNAPAGTTINSWTAVVTNGVVSLPATTGSGNLDQTITTLPNGAVVTYTVRLDIPSDYNSNLVNTAAVTTGTPDPNPACPACTAAPLSPAAEADIVTVKSTSATNYVPGQSVTYTITVTNNGPSDAANVNVTDNAPAGTTISSWTAAVTNGSVTLPNTSGSGNINETITALPNGAVVTYTVTVAVPSSFSANLTNTATVTSPTPDPNPGCTTCTTPPISAAPSADIVTTKTTGATSYVPGQSVTYTITVTNNGPSDAANVNVVDNAPAGTTISSWTAAVTTGSVTLPNTSGSGNINETITALPNGAVVTYTVTVAIPSGFTGSLSNTAAVTSPTPDPTPGCTACTTTPITAAPSADIVTVKTTQTAGQTTFTPGENVIYTITVTNNGPSNAATVNVKDIAPTGTTIAAWTASVTTGSVTLPNTSGTGNLDETIATLPNGAVVTYTVTVQTPATFTGTLSNTATVTSATPDPDPACAACTTVPLTAVAVATAPVAGNDALEGKADNTLTIPVLGNDKPGTGASPSPIDPSTLEIVEQPKHGTVKISEDGTLTYTPDRGYTGQETFTYRVQDEAGNWSNVATVTLNIVPNDLDIPNMITPNGDGANDRFVIKGLEKYTQHEIIIFNRWNNMLFRSRNYQGDWEGKGLNAGTYYYTLKVQENNGQWHTYNGYIMLMR